MQDEVAQTLKAEAKRIRPSEPVTTTKLPATKADFINTTKDSATDKLLEGEEDTPYESDLSENEEDEGDDEYDDEDEDDDEPEDDEQIMTQCPDYCRCAGEYAAATTATYVLGFS